LREAGWPAVFKRGRFRHPLAKARENPAEF